MSEFVLDDIKKQLINISSIATRHEHDEDEVHPGPLVQACKRNVEESGGEVERTERNETKTRNAPTVNPTSERKQASKQTTHESTLLEL